MLTDGLKASLDDAWRPARRAGVLGNASTEELWEHTAGFTSAVCSAFSADCSTWNGHILDAGTGAGVPGVLLACQLPMANFVLVDSSERRLDHVRAAIRAAALGLLVCWQSRRKQQNSSCLSSRQGELQSSRAEAIKLMTGDGWATVSTVSIPSWWQHRIHDRLLLSRYQGSSRPRTPDELRCVRVSHSSESPPVFHVKPSLGP
jgi:hypothetical protein